MSHRANKTLAIPLVDLAAQQALIRDGLDRAIAGVLEHGQYILGPEIEALERELTRRSNAGQVITCSSGTDGLVLALMAYDVGPGDAVMVPSFSFVASAEAVVLCGATPIFIDVTEQDFLLNPNHLNDAYAAMEQLGLRPRGIIAVDLFGQPADYHAINEFADASGVFVIADAAQSFGASLDGAPVGSLAPVTVTSFYPSKPLGCYGDGGAIFVNDQALAGRIRRRRVHGFAPPGTCADIGINGRMDTLQAAILLEKLRLFDDEITARRKLAEAYNAALNDVVVVPEIHSGRQSVWAQYTICTDARDRLAQAIRRRGIAVGLHYTRPIHTFPSYAGYPRSPRGVQCSERIAERALNLPVHPYLSPADQDLIITVVREVLA